MSPEMAFSGVAVASATTSSPEPEDIVDMAVSTTTNSSEILPPPSTNGGISIKLNPSHQSRRAKRPAMSTSSSSSSTSSSSSSSNQSNGSSTQFSNLHIKSIKIDSIKPKKHQPDDYIQKAPINGSNHHHHHHHHRFNSTDSGANAHFNIPLPPIPQQINNDSLNVLTPPTVKNGFAKLDPLINAGATPTKSAPATPPDSPIKELPEHIEKIEQIEELPPPAVDVSPDLSPDLSTLPPLQNPLNISQIAYETPTNKVALISAKTLVSAIDYHYSQHLPDVDAVFPWMHGLHPNNLCQRAFLDPLKRYRDSSGIYFDLSQVNEDLLDDSAMFKNPEKIHGLLIMKVGDENNIHGTLVGTVSAEEILSRKEEVNEFDENNNDDDVNESENQEESEISTISNTSITTTTVASNSIASKVTTNAAFNAVNYIKEVRKKSISEESTTYSDNIIPRHIDPTPKENSVAPSDSDVDMIDESDSELNPISNTSDDSDCPYIDKFLYLDPPEGISLRNFQIQVSKWATFSDICIYAPDPKDRNYARKIALLVSQAQQNFHQANPHFTGDYRTFFCDATVEEIQHIAPHAVSIPPQSNILDEEEVRLKNWDSNFLFHERVEMSMMSSASPIGNVDVDDQQHGGGVWLGNTVDFETYIDMCHTPTGTSAIDDSIRARNWATFIECFEGPQLPPFQVLDQYINEAETILECSKNGTPTTTTLTPLSIQFPSSGSIPLSECNDDVFFAIVSLCKLLYLRSKVPYHDGHAGVLIYCNDGYTETSLIALAYIIYSTGVSSSQAWIDLHVKYNRPFFCFTVDVLVIMALERMLLEYSPAIPSSKFHTNNGAVYIEKETNNEPTSGLQISSEMPPWFVKLDGSLPSKILPHMYLGSLHHAENPEMLVQLGIKRILSVGESLTWMSYDNATSRGSDSCGTIYDVPYNGLSKVMYMDNIQDDGVDALTSSLSACLNFIDEGYKKGEPTLVHCRVGVSRSATVCIAEVMKRLSVGLPRAYLFVRVRRLNVIIQPNLRFMYELVKWEEMNRQNGEGWLREVDWHILCREIAIINKVYIS